MHKKPPVRGHAERECIPNWQNWSYASRSRHRPGGRSFYAGLVKSRELAHDAQLYHLFEVERAKLEYEGSRVTRVVLDYEFKRDYHAFVHRQRATGVDVNAVTHSLQSQLAPLVLASSIGTRGVL